MTNETRIVSPFSYWYVKAIVAGIAIVFVGFVIYAMIFGPTPETSQTEICAHAEVFIETKLIAPSSAHFQPCDEMGLARVGTDGHEYVLTGYVDAQNAFGASLRHSFTVDLRQDGDSWSTLNWSLQ